MEDQLIRFKCPNCQAKISVNAEFSGKKGQCFKCKEIVEIPKQFFSISDLTEDDPIEYIAGGDFDLSELAAIEYEPKDNIKKNVKKLRKRHNINTWLRRYGDVNYILCIIACLPMFLIVVIAFSIGAIGHGFLYLLGAALLFMYLNIFTIICYWAERVLELLEEIKEKNDQ